MCVPSGRTFLFGERKVEIYRVAFIGHRVISNILQIEYELEKIIKELMCSHTFVEFYIGRNGDFDIIAASAIKRACKNCNSNNCELILVLPYANKDECYFEHYYDNILYPIDSKTHYKNAIQKRNEWQIDNTDLLIAYVEPDRTGGALKTLQYALKTNTPTINLYNQREMMENSKEKVIFMDEVWDKENFEWFKKALVEGINRRIDRELAEDEEDNK